MARANRKPLIEALEARRGTRVLTYVTSDRQPAGAQIGEDAVRPIHDELRVIGEVPRLDLFVYSRGGALEVPWRIASALREFAQEWRILIPFRANSAATLLALGADEIIFGRHGELGPIDPILNLQRMAGTPGQPPTVTQDTINVEDVMAYLKFVREQVGLTDQAALSQSLGSLAGRLDAVGLGSVYRTRSHTRDVAYRMLTSRKRSPSERVMETIVETLAERVYAHGHGIAFGEAKDIGLPVRKADTATDEAMTALLEAYEADMKTRETLDPVAAVATDDKYEEDAILAVIEGSAAAHEFRAKLEVRAQRPMPPNLNVALNLALNLPPGLDPATLPAQLQPLLQQLQQDLLQEAQDAVRLALKDQAPLAGAELSIRNGQWVRTE